WTRSQIFLQVRVKPQTVKTRSAPTLLPRRVLPVRVRNFSLSRVAVMDQHAIAERQRPAGGDGDAAVALGVVIEIVLAKGIHRKQAVCAGMPVSGVLRVR